MDSNDETAADFRCEAKLRVRGVRHYDCTEPVLGRVSLVCVHEHLFAATLCQSHIDRVEAEGKCIECSNRDLPDEHRHKCRVWIARVEELERLS